MDLCSLDQIKRPVYLKLCLPYLVVLNLGKEKSSAFQRYTYMYLCYNDKGLIYGTKLFLTLYINIAKS